MHPWKLYTGVAFLKGNSSSIHLHLRVQNVSLPETQSRSFAPEQWWRKGEADLASFLRYFVTYFQGSWRNFSSGKLRSIYQKKPKKLHPWSLTKNAPCKNDTWKDNPASGFGNFCRTWISDLINARLISVASTSSPEGDRFGGSLNGRGTLKIGAFIRISNMGTNEW